MPGHDFILIFVEPLNRLGIDYMVTGAVASIFYGKPRLTHDIDIVMILKPGDIDRFRSEFPEEDYYCPPAEVISTEVLRPSHAHINLIHHSTGLKADCYIYTGDKLHIWAFDHRREITIGSGLRVKLAPPEYVIIRKLQYFKESGSQKHIDDVRSILDHSADLIDQKFLQSELDNRGLAEHLPVPE
jgi:hypothetical protein